MTAAEEQLEVSRVINASRERLFAAWTDPAQIVQWWGSGGVACTSAEMDLTLGGSYRIANTTPDGMTMWIAGEFTHIDPPRAVSYTWAIEPLTASTSFSLVEVTFDAEAEGTLVRIRHSQIASPNERGTFLEGWLGCLDGLQRLIGC